MVKEKTDLKKRFIHRAKIGNTVYEVVTWKGTSVFLCYTKGKGFHLENSIETYQEILYPMPKRGLPYRDYKLTEQVWKQLEAGKINVDKQQLYLEIFDKIDTYLVTNPAYKALIVAQILESYIQFKFNAVGYIFFTGSQDSGKSRACELIQFLSYRPMFGLSLNASNIYNYIGCDEENEGQVTIIEDEFAEINRNEAFDRLKIYRSGYRRGNSVPRILDAGSSQRMQVFYRTFCSKIFNGYKLPKDSAFQSRCIEIPMSTGEPECDEVLPEHLPDFDEIKFKALIWRMQTYFDPLPQMEIKLSGRMKEIWKCKMYAVHGTTAEEEIKNLAYKDIKQKVEELHETLECRVIEAVLTETNYFGYGLPIPFKVIWSRLLKVLDMTQNDYDNLAERGAVFAEGIDKSISHVTVGRILLNVIHGIRKHGGKEIGRVYSFDKDTVERLAKKYQIEVKNTAKQ